ncbi:MAG: IMP dehydrogenase [archaeon]
MNEWNKRFFAHNKFDGLSFDDVLVKPNYSDLLPFQADITTNLTDDIKLLIPYVSADMDKVTESRMAIALAKLGGMGFLWKSPDISVQEGWVNEVKYAVNGLIPKPITINPDQTLADVKEKIEKYKRRFSTLVVVNDKEEVVGLVTKDNLQFATLDNKVSEFMIKKPIAADHPMTISEAHDLMKNKKIGKLIVTDKNGILAGLYCWKDVQNIVEGKTPTFNRDPEGGLRVGANVGVIDFASGNPNDSDVLERAERLLRKRCDVLLVGVAHGHSLNVIETIKAIKSHFSSYRFGLVAGNVATYEGAKALFEAGADAVKVGLGPGSICTTRVISGCGVPQITAVYEAGRAGREYGRPIIADGGIKYSGDVVKALVAGGNSVMIGNLFAATEESPGEVILDQQTGQRIKEYRGMGSLEAMKDNNSGLRYGAAKGKKVTPEGVAGKVFVRGSLDDYLSDTLIGGLRAGMGYIGARTISEMQERGKFLRITDQGVKESHVHDIIMTKQPEHYAAEKR